MISLKEVNKDNFWEVIDLKVSDIQEDYVLSNAISLGQAKVQPECQPLAIYDDEILVGFLMYCLDVDDQEYWIYRMMVDEQYQNSGVGKAALSQLIERIQADESKHQIFLDVSLDNKSAVYLYKRFGFKFTGQVFGKAHVMVLEY
ncbi:MAG TPA: spermidine acetyltransferase [Firmicutes bacterium]|nr:spermidine acetyltransferase [Bacillota bacterium]